MEIKELKIEGERVFVKKSKVFGWGFVNPSKIDGKTNWKNLLIGGSWVKFGALMFILLVLWGASQEYLTAISIAEECIYPLSTIVILP